MMKTFSMIVTGIMLVAQSALASIPEEGSQYMSDYIPGVGRFELVFDKDMQVRLTHNQNECSYNDVGSIYSCTLIAYSPFKAKLEVRPVVANRRTMVFKVGNTKYDIVVLYGQVESIRLLKRNNQGRVVLSVLMNRLSSPTETNIIY